MSVNLQYYIYIYIINANTESPERQKNIDVIMYLGGLTL
jgi:hypothetical protein